MSLVPVDARPERSVSPIPLAVIDASIHTKHVNGKVTEGAIIERLAMCTHSLSGGIQELSDRRIFGLTNDGQVVEAHGIFPDDDQVEVERPEQYHVSTGAIVLRLDRSRPVEQFGYQNKRDQLWVPLNGTAGVIRRIFGAYVPSPPREVVEQEPQQKIEEAAIEP